MELSPGQQRLLFVVVVIVLVGLGFFLIEGRSHGTTAAPATTPTPSASASATVSPASAAAAATPPATEPAATPPATTAGGANIYQWLPFTQPDLTAAAKTTLAFAKDYVTWNSKESKAAYGATMAGLVTTQEDTTLENDFATAARAAGNAVSTGSGSIDSISSFGANPASITFSVTLTQQVVPAQGTSASPSQYDITVVSTGAGWQVNNIQLFSVGNQ
jgi:hypothetical protein